MARSQGLAPMLLFSTLLLNVFLTFLVVPSNAELSWTRRAAVEAEAVADISCSGHGRAFVDGVLDDGKPVCECNKCYAGPDCSQLQPNCSADADSGDPLFLEPYWMRNAEGSAVVLSGWHRMSYNADGRPYMTRELERHIRILHRLVGNAATDGKYMVFGGGSTQLLNAALHALAPDNSSTPASVVSTIPYYPAYRTQTQFWKSKVFEWKGATSDWVNSTEASTKDFIEFVTSPNNPDGRWQDPVLGGAAVIQDRAYYWPHYAAIKTPVDDDVMLFTISKVTGHAGSRFGWALIKDETVYNRTQEYMDLNSLGISRETQLRALKLIKVMISKIKVRGDIFRSGYALTRDRWAKLSAVVSSSDRFSLQNLSPEYCNYFRTSRDPSPAYAWLKCERAADRDCYAVVTAGGIIPRRGTLFGADSSYVRLSLIRSQDDFDLMLQRMKELASKSQGLAPMLLFSVLLLNVFLPFLVVPSNAELSWTRRAAEEAEAVGAIACSGHGRAYVDGVREDGMPVCECNKCYTGPDCSQPQSNCSADANSGDPLFLEPYWMRHAAGSTVVASGWHRMSYDTDGRPYMTRELERHIRILHRLVGNAATDGKYMVFGGGSTQLLNAALHSLAPENSSTPASVFATIPYNPVSFTLSLSLYIDFATYT
ncbi:hypothetical protein Taro_007952 [Colocasia esculenta]|uniref:Uncharacterized protein n=1 Tax=Colocasia esculenta TaxID=4460 RepID=A0A843U0G9_COLES|nr:hypothetical protein [Colocasia esculenta]